MSKENDFEIKFYEYLNHLEVINKVRISHCMSAGIYGVSYGEYVEDYYIDDITEIEGLSGFTFIDGIIVDNYGFIEYSDEVESYKFIENSNLVRGYEGSIKISKIVVQPFSKQVHVQYCLNRDAHEIYLLANDNLLYLELMIYGCFKELDFWRKILYQSYVLYKVGDIIGSFINMFIAFESMLRAETGLGAEDKLNTVYCSYIGATNNMLPKELHAYRLIRNELLHGENDLASYLDESDLLRLIQIMHNLFRLKSPYEEGEKVKKTKAAKKALDKEYKQLKKR